MPISAEARLRAVMSLHVRRIIVEMRTIRCTVFLFSIYFELYLEIRRQLNESTNFSASPHLHEVIRDHELQCGNIFLDEVAR
jgi:hypothetical protein